LIILAVAVAVAAVPAALAKPSAPKPKIAVPTAPSITGAVYTTVDTHHPNFAAECHNGNPAVNCNQYWKKEFVYLNGGPTKNQLNPDGVYFYAVLVPGGQAQNANDNTPNNLSDDYDCYLNRRIQLTNGEVTGIYSDPCGVGAAPHLFDAPFVQLFPYADTTNPGGEYIMAVCYIGPDSSSRLPATGVDTNKACKFDAFKVLTDDQPPICKLVATSAGPPKSVTVVVQDAGGGLESVLYSVENATVTFPDPLVVGTEKPFYIIATKIDQTKSASLGIVVKDIGGNVTDCDPILPAQRLVKLTGTATTLLRGLRPTQNVLLVRNAGKTTSQVVVRVNGHVLRVRNLKAHEARLVHLKLSYFAPGAHNRLSITRRVGHSKIVVTLS
jgi:hypothetical protein